MINRETIFSFLFLELFAMPCIAWMLSAFLAAFGVNWKKAIYLAVILSTILMGFVCYKISHREEPQTESKVSMLYNGAGRDQPFDTDDDYENDEDYINYLSIGAIPETNPNPKEKPIEETEETVAPIVLRQSSPRDPKVFICTGPQSKKYHKTRYCRGLESCSGRIIKIKREEAKKRGRTPCGFCY